MVSALHEFEILGIPGLKFLTLCKPKKNISWQALNNKFEILKKTPEDVKSAQVPCVNVFRLAP